MSKWSHLIDNHIKFQKDNHIRIYYISMLIAFKFNYIPYRRNKMIL